eukprot:TRINITY_DN11198_c0_g2_i6.p1 TRINITY_DN11198_c0_g2~~TRINITY_DN11198_c0_g2_i6.p1  ORF type:complete len:874 (-),score=126.68 TRINITY_DN11198_c0_g2_i6:645-3059(-)
MARSRELQDAYSRSTRKTTALLEQTVFHNVSVRAMTGILHQLSSSLAEDIIVSAQRSSMTLLNVLDSQGQVDMAGQNGFIGALALLELSGESLYAFPVRRRVEFGRSSSSFDTVRDFLGWIRVGFAGGRAVSVAVRRNATGQTVAATYISQLPGKSSALKYPIDLITGFVNVSAPGNGEPVRPLEPRTWYHYSKQEEHARAAAAQPGAHVELLPAWSPIIEDKRLRPSISLGTPIAFCGNYSCLSGVVEIGIRLWHMASYLRDFMVLVRYLLDAKRLQSAVFIIDISRQNLESQRELLIGAYEYGSDYPGNLVNATDANSSVVRSASKALFLHNNKSWQSEGLEKGQILDFQLSLIEDETPRLVRCRNLGDAGPEGDCIVTVTEPLRLDENTQWPMVLSVARADMRLKDETHFAEIQSNLKLELSDAQQGLAELNIIGWSTVGAGLMSSLLVAWIASCCIHGPVKQLCNLEELMRQLDTSLAIPRTASGSPRSRSHRPSMIREISQAQQTFSNLAHSVELSAFFVPRKVVHDWILGSLQPAVSPCFATILFSDIKDSTTLAETLAPERLMQLLSSYFECMTEIVQQHKGEVTELLGDGMLALWNTPQELAEHALWACRSALAMQQAMPGLNAAMASQELPALSVRIGLHTGHVLAGIIGSAKKKKFGCIGDAMNLASRIEDLCKVFRADILCSEATIEALPASHGLPSRRLGRCRVKGKADVTMVYEMQIALNGQVGDLSERARSYEQALMMYESRQLDEALALTAAHTEAWPEDAASQRLPDAARKALSSTGDDQWMGIVYEE